MKGGASALHALRARSRVSPVAEVHSIRRETEENVNRTTPGAAQREEKDEGAGAAKRGKTRGNEATEGGEELQEW